MTSEPLNEYKKPVVPSKNEDTKKGNGGVAGAVKKAIKTVRTGDVSKFFHKEKL